MDCTQMPYDVWIFFEFSAVLHRTRGHGGPATYFADIRVAWSRIAQLLELSEMEAVLVIAPLENARRDYEHSHALEAWALRAAQLLGSDSSVSVLAIVLREIPVPYVHREKINRDRTHGFVRQLALFLAPTSSG